MNNLGLSRTHQSNALGFGDGLSGLLSKQGMVSEFRSTCSSVTHLAEGNKES